MWEFLGKSSTENSGKKADDSVQLDFGLSTNMLDEKVKSSWPYEFGLVYSVTLGKGSLEVQMQVQNKGDKTFEFKCLFHTYLAVKVHFDWSCADSASADVYYRISPQPQSQV